MPKTLPFNKEDIVGRECKHATYVESKDKRSDLLVIKERVHLKDGRTFPKMTYIQNYERTFGITLPGYRNHNEKKEFEDLSKLQIYKTPQFQLTDRIAAALELRGSGNTTLRRLARNPYLYGADVTTPVLIKQQYREKYPGCISKSTVCFLDIETFMEGPLEGEILAVTATHKSHACMAVVHDFVKTMPVAEETIRKAIDKYLKKYIDERKIDLEIVIVNTPAQAVKTVISRVHEWQPDFLAAWNMNFDFPKMIRALEKEYINVEDVFSDPKLPKRYRKAKYIEASAVKVTATGKVTPLDPWERWHRFEVPASFYVVDSMSVYHKLRFQVEGKQDSYKLGDVLEKHLGVRKLNFTFADHLGGADWHKFMQELYPAEYLAYNLFDCIGGELLDEKLGDLSDQLTQGIEASEYGKYPSTPRRLVDDNHFFFLQYGKMIGTTSDQMVHELDELVTDMNGWIVTLPSHLIKDNGIKLFSDMPDHTTEVRTGVADFDVKGAYPTGQQILNMSRATTLIEVCGIQGKPGPEGQALMRKCSLNMVGGPVNAVEMCQDLYHAPKLSDLRIAFRNSRQSL